MYNKQMLLCRTLILSFTVFAFSLTNNALASVSGRCISNKDSSEYIDFADYGNIILIGTLEFKKIKRGSNEISGFVDNGDYAWNFKLTNKRKLTLRVSLGTTSDYDRFAGGVRTVFGYKCDLKTKSQPESNSDSNNSLSTNSLTEMRATKLCNYATRDGNWDTSDKYYKYVQEAKRRGLTCGVKDFKTKSSNNSKLDKAKSTCTELGFTAGTEKHGECVLKIIDN